MMLGFGAHSLVLERMAASTLNPLWAYYALNYALGAATVVVFLRLSRKKAHLLGFAFMGTSILKLILFLVLFFEAIMQQQPELKRQEFVHFFVPYGLGLLTEVLFLVRHMNKQH